MTEEELENGIEPEVITPEKQLTLKVQEFQLEPTDVQFLLGKFEEDFKMVALWAKKAKDIVVTNENQKVEMEAARTGRLYLAKIRNGVENNRKALKESSLKRGRAIDGVANFIKDLIIPTEKYLDMQEHYVEYKKAAEDKAILEREHARIESERIAEEKRKAEENARLQAENERLKNEQEKIKAENEAKIAKERAEQQAKLDLVRKEQEIQLAKERAEREKVEAELRAKKQEELKKEADNIREQERLASAGDLEKLQAFKKAVQGIVIPDVKSAENKRIILDAKSHLYLAISKIQDIQQEEI